MQQRHRAVRGGRFGGQHSRRRLSRCQCHRRCGALDQRRRRRPRVRWRARLLRRFTVCRPDSQVRCADGPVRRVPERPRVRRYGETEMRSDQPSVRSVPLRSRLRQPHPELLECFDLWRLHERCLLRPRPPVRRRGQLPATARFVCEPSSHRAHRGATARFEQTHRVGSTTWSRCAARRGLRSSSIHSP